MKLNIESLALLATNTICLNHKTIMLESMRKHFPLTIMKKIDRYEQRPLAFMKKINEVKCRVSHFAQKKNNFIVTSEASDSIFILINFLHES